MQRINPNQDYEVRDWAKKFGVTPGGTEDRGGESQQPSRGCRVTHLKNRKQKPTQHARPTERKYHGKVIDIDLRSERRQAWKR